MKSILSRLFGKSAPRSLAGTDMVALSSELSYSDIESYYLSIIMDCLRRLLVPADSISVRVRSVGRGPAGTPAFAGYLNLVRWDPVAPVLLQNLPVIDARVRKLAEASVILEHTHFDGLWVRANASMPGAPRALAGMPAELVRQPVTGGLAEPRGGATSGFRA